MPAHFIRAHHAGLDVTVTLPATALRHLDGWAPEDPAEVIPVAENGTVSQVLAEVGDDPTKAAAALAVEQDRTKPRTTLVDALTTIAAPTEEI